MTDYRLELIRDLKHVTLSMIVADIEAGNRSIFTQDPDKRTKYMATYIDTAAQLLDDVGTKADEMIE